MVCGGLWWFACIVSGFTAYVSNYGGDLWWFAVMCGGLSFSHVPVVGLPGLSSFFYSEGSNMTITKLPTSTAADIDIFP